MNIDGVFLSDNKTKVGGKHAMKHIYRIMMTVGLVFLMTSVTYAGTQFLNVAKSSGIEVVEEDGVTIWRGKYGGQIKPNGPLKGKKIALFTSSEFSDHQAYYFMSYIGEYGGLAEFVLNNHHLWKEVRPNFGSVTPHGMWGLSLDPVRVMGGTNKLSYKFLLGDNKADPADYDAMIIMGDHAGDVAVADPKALEFIKAVVDRGVPVAAIGGGIMPLIHLGYMDGKKATGNRSVDYMLKEIGDFVNAPVVTDGKIITGRHTIDSAAVLRALCKSFDPKFQDKTQGILAGKTVMILITDDWEDIELSAPLLELVHRGADFSVGLFEPETKSRGSLLGVDTRVGNYGTTIPFQEIPESYYKIIKKENIKMSDFDLAFIPGAFNPWQMTVKHREWLRDAGAAGKLLGAICHGAIPLAAADLLRGKKVAGWDACFDSVEIMGGKHLLGTAAVIDGNIVTGQTPPQVPEFVDAMTEALLRQ